MQSGTDVKGNAPHQIAQNQLIPQIVNRTRNAVRVNGQEFLFFQRKQAGRRCSCFSVEQAPEGKCGICFATGFVGGYEKYGCETETVDVTRPGLRLVNVEPNYEARTRPVLFGLIEGAISGYIECDIEVRRNVGLVDNLMVSSSVADPRNSSVSATVLAGAVWRPLSEQTVGTLLQNRSIKIRVQLTRRLATMESPFLSHMFIRYRKLERPRILADIPRRRKSVVLAEFGINDSYETINLATADEPRNISTEDFFVMTSEGTRWKVVDESENKPGDILTAHDVMCRRVHAWEAIAMVPL